MESTKSMTIELPDVENIMFPSFTSSITISGPRREKIWKSAKEIVNDLKEKGVSVTSQTLLNMEKRGQLHANKISPRKIQFDLNEIFYKFKIE